MIREDTLTVLRAIRDNGPITTIALTQMNVAGGACKSQVNNLVNVHGLIEPWDFEAHRQRYVISLKGERLLKMMDAAQAEPGKYPEPRTGFSAEPFKPKPWTPPRAECTQHEGCQSVRNGQKTPYARPFSNSGKALQAIGLHGGVL
jgi:hypothetical protein